MGLFTQNGLLRTTFFTNDGLLRLLYDPTLVVDLDLRTDALPPGLTFSRPSAKTGFVNGQLVQYASGVPAISVANGYFGENEQRTNSIFPSVGSIFTASGTGTITATENAGLAPDGTMTTLKINSSTTLAYYFKQTSMTPNGTYTGSCFVKKTASTQYFTFKQWYLGGTAASATYNLNTATGQWVSGLGGTAYVEDCGDFWRVGICLVDTGSNNTARIAIQPAISGVDFEIWGYQQESGEGMTSYIPTTTAASTRAADVLYATPAINSIEGTLAVQFTESPEYTTGKWTRAARISDGTSSNQLHVYNSPGSSNFNIHGTSAGVLLADGSIGGASPQPYKWAAAYSPSGIVACANNGDIVNVAGSSPVGLNRIEIGQAGFCGNVYRVRFYNVRKTNAEIKNLTAA